VYFGGHRRDGGRPQGTTVGPGLRLSGERSVLAGSAFGSQGARLDRQTPSWPWAIVCWDFGRRYRKCSERHGNSAAGRTKRSIYWITKRSIYWINCPRANNPKPRPRYRRFGWRLPAPTDAERAFDHFLGGYCLKCTRKQRRIWRKTARRCWPSTIFPHRLFTRRTSGVG